MKARDVVTAVLFSAAAATVSAYTLLSYAYEDMFKQSDLVVIARPVASHDTGERHLDRQVRPPVPVAGVTTACDALYVLKGPKLRSLSSITFEISLIRSASWKADPQASHSTYLRTIDI